MIVIIDVFVFPQKKSDGKWQSQLASKQAPPQRRVGDPPRCRHLTHAPRARCRARPKNIIRAPGSCRQPGARPPCTKRFSYGKLGAAPPPRRVGDPPRSRHLTHAPRARCPARPKNAIRAPGSRRQPGACPPLLVLWAGWPKKTAEFFSTPTCQGQSSIRSWWNRG